VTIAPNRGRVRCAAEHASVPLDTVTPEQVTLDYVVEERERELADEFNRWYDLARPGAEYFVNRVRLYNPHGLSVAEKHALRPVPTSHDDDLRPRA